MARTGRPKKPADEVLSERVEIRLTADEKSRFEAAAQVSGKSLSEWMRQNSLKAAARRVAKK